MADLSNFAEDMLTNGLFRSPLPTVRVNSTAYSVGDRVMLGTSDLSVYECITAGTSAAAPPAFNTAIGDTTTDGTVTWLTCKVGPVQRPLYLALFTAVTDAEAGTGTEVSGGAYARQAYHPGNANWGASSNGATSNSNIITFPTATANWGTITHAALFDRLTGGNPVSVIKALAANKIINSGDVFRFPAGDVDFVFA